MGLRLITAPITEPVELWDEIAREFLRLDGDELDNNVGSLLKTAREAAEEYQNRAYMQQIWELSFDTYPNLPLEMPKPPLLSLKSVKIYNSDNEEIEIDLNDFIVDIDSDPGRIAFKKGKSWPYTPLRSINAVKIQFEAGYKKADDVPGIVKTAILIYAAHRLENPNSGDVPEAFYHALRGDRMRVMLP